ncbi:hypothetical protein BG003_002737 [Podila horticola]|nr:hypothetical protein BG003_002737 [Podila horticola]
MKFSIKALGVTVASASLATGTPIEFTKRDIANDRLITKCIDDYIATKAWPSGCQAAVAVPLGFIRDFKVSQLSLDFTTADPWMPTVTAGNVAITFLGIPGITLPITSVAEHSVVSIKSGQVGNIEHLSAPVTVKGNTVTVSYPGSPLSVFSLSHTSFLSLVAGLVNLGDATIALQGGVDATFNLGALGSNTIYDIGFEADSPFKGLGGLKVMDFVELISSSMANNKLTVTAAVNVKSLSDISFKLGTVVFVASTAVGDVGTATFHDLSLVPGDNLVGATIVIDLSLPAGAAFKTALQAAAGTLTLKGTSSSSSNVALIPALTAVQTSLTILTP